MPTCPNCSKQYTGASCPRCASDVTAPSDATAPSSAPPPSSADNRFAPGTILADRYRIVAALGKGGMGEVYRADDLKLGHPVALKFLPREFAANPDLLARFHAEVRNARQVSHPNVCRVYDIGEFHALHYLTMEYIDGEDLASLLRRIGRLPADKGVEIAHQICSGLAAAHDVGLLHRDLKPANIMLDGRGRARITDFGLAVGTEDSHERFQFAGTPAYMAPEQRTGAPASVLTDIYALGLVLFEIFTGKRAFEDGNLDAWRDPSHASPASAARSTTKPHSGSSSAPRPISSLTTDIDPAVRAAILRCLETDPARRPPSAMRVSAALPGGDPLAAALAAGETPSPEMVAAAGEDIAISTGAAITVTLVIFALLAAAIPLARRGTILGLAPNVKSRELLEARAQEIAKAAGYPDTPEDTYGYYGAPQSYIDWRAQQDPNGWYHTIGSAVPDVYRYTYRGSPQPLLALDTFSNPSSTDPPMTVPGMTTTLVDGSGRLLLFSAVPPASDKDLPAAAQPDWPAFFAATGWNLADFKSSDPHQLPNVAFDTRAAWEAISSGNALRIEAVSLRGKIVDFRVTGPWASQTPSRGNTPVAFQLFFELIVYFILPVIGIFFARRNLRLGRGDPHGATRLSLLVVFVIAWNTLLSQHWVAHPGILNDVISNTGLALLLSSMVWVSYVALEPVLRRHSPQLLIGWSRLVSGHFVDGVVGRDVLAGCAGGAFLNVVHMTAVATPWWRSVRGFAPYGALSIFNDASHFIASIFSQVWPSILITLSIAFLYAIMRLIVRRPLIAVIMVYAFVWPLSFNSEGSLMQLTVGTIGCLLFVFIFFRFGLLALAVELYVGNMLYFYPLVLRANAWYTIRPALVLLLVIAIVLYGFRASLAGRPLFSHLLDEA